MQHKLENHRSVRRPAQLEGLPLGSKVSASLQNKRFLFLMQSDSRALPVCVSSGGHQEQREPPASHGIGRSAPEPLVSGPAHPH